MMALLTLGLVMLVGALAYVAGVVRGYSRGIRSRPDWRQERGELVDLRDRLDRVKIGNG